MLVTGMYPPALASEGFAEPTTGTITSFDVDFERGDKKGYAWDPDIPPRS
jgi:hypothetical protein